MEDNTVATSSVTELAETLACRAASCGFGGVAAGGSPPAVEGRWKEAVVLPLLCAVAPGLNRRE